MRTEPLISAVLNLHREGRLCLPTIDSLRAAVDRAALDGITSEILVVLDRCDALTESLAVGSLQAASILRADLGDLGLARNRAVAVAAGRFVSFLDGDDLWGDDWLAACVDATARFAEPTFVMHPEANLYFQKGRPPHLFLHPDQARDQLRLDDLAVDNYWTALSFAPIEVCRRFPYRASALSGGYGYEDWLWNFETMRAGITHVAVDGTIHLIRRKPDTGLLAESYRSNVVPDFAGLIQAEGRASPPDGASGDSPADPVICRRGRGPAPACGARQRR